MSDSDRFEEVVSEDGTPIAVWTSGEGPPLVLVHGTAADHNRWGPVLPAFEEHFTVMAVDRRGRGKSGDAEQYSLEAEVRDVVAVVEGAGEGVSLLGHSYGAVCALEACRLTENVRRLVLYEPPLGFLASPPHVVQRLHELLEAGERDELIGYFMQEVAGLTAEQVDAMRSMPAWKARLTVAHTIPREERANREYQFDPVLFSGLTVPTLFLLGGDSPEPFKQGAAAAQAALGNFRLTVMEGQRHNAMDMATDLFTAEVVAFLEEG